MGELLQYYPRVSGWILRRARLPLRKRQAVACWPLLGLEDHDGLHHLDVLIDPARVRVLS